MSFWIASNPGAIGCLANLKTPMPRPKTTPPLTPAILQAALAGLQKQRNKLDEQIVEVRALLGRRAPGRPLNNSDAEQRTRPQRRPLTFAARKKISLVQKRRWAAVRAKQRGGKKSRTKAAAKEKNV
jgi:hypothetical protein